MDDTVVAELVTGVLEDCHVVGPVRCVLVPADPTWKVRRRRTNSHSCINKISLLCSE